MFGVSPPDWLGYASRACGAAVTGSGVISSLSPISTSAAGVSVGKEETAAGVEMLFSLAGKVAVGSTSTDLVAVARGTVGDGSGALSVGAKVGKINGVDVGTEVDVAVAEGNVILMAALGLPAVRALIRFQGRMQYHVWHA